MIMAIKTSQECEGLFQIDSIVSIQTCREIEDTFREMPSFSILHSFLSRFFAFQWEKDTSIKAIIIVINSYN